MNTTIKITILSFFLILFSCKESDSVKNEKIDSYSYNLGILGGFSELVNYGVKKLALSEPMSKQEMDSFIIDAAIVAERNHVNIFRENDLIVTCLFPSDVAIGKEVVLIYNGNTLNEYLSLKERIKTIPNDSLRLKQELSKEFGKMLSYPDTTIVRLINGTSCK